MRKGLLAVLVGLVCVSGIGWAEEAAKFRHTDDTITTKDVMAMSEKACKLIAQKGDEALPVISKPDGDFQEGALYGFVYDENVVMLAHPEKPALIGQSFKGKPDVKGKKFRDEIVAKALAGGGWTEYIYSKPDTPGLFMKKVYSKLVEKGGKKYIVAVGMYGGKM